MTAPVSTLEAELVRAAQAITQSPRDAAVLLGCHVNPDGDALGSMLAFALALRKLGFAQVWASFPEPYDVPDVFRFLPGLDLLVPSHMAVPAQAVPRPDLALSFDAASTGRLGELMPAFEAARTWIVLDHHASNTGFGGIRLIDPDAAATAVVTARLIDQLGVELDAAIATCLYVGLVTDTGSFRFDSTTTDVLELAARLVDAGADPGEISRRVFDTRPFAAIRLLARVLDRIELDPAAAAGRGLVSAYATNADLVAHGQPAHVLESFMDVVRTAAEADVACLVKPAGPDTWSVSLRSKGGTDVAAVAVALGGGGHRLAAGFTGRGDVHDVLGAVRAQLAAA